IEQFEDRALLANSPPVWITTQASVSEPLGQDPNPVQRSVLLSVSDQDAGQMLTFGLVGTGSCDPVISTYPFTNIVGLPGSVTSAGGTAIDSIEVRFNVGANDGGNDIGIGLGMYCMRINVSDGTASATQDLLITVTQENSNPVVSHFDNSNNTGTIPLAEDNTSTITVRADDPDLGQTLSFSVVQGDATCPGMPNTSTV